MQLVSPSAHPLAAAIVLAALVLPGCVTPADMRAKYARESAGSVGCKPEEILIRDEEYASNGSPATWTAYCNEKRYQCTGSRNGLATCSLYQQ